MNKNSLIIVIGAYGSGKSEYAINLALQLHNEYNITERSNNVCLVDLDIVNPYFRSREVKDLFEKKGIAVIAPESVYQSSDLPMISPLVKGSITNLNKTVILDVGGDPAGCRALARFADYINNRTYSMQLVINIMRPFTSNLEEIITMKNNLEYTSKLRVTELVCNTNLMDLTDETLISEGIEVIKEVANKENLHFEKYLVLNDQDNKYPDMINGIKKVNIFHHLKKPWDQ